MSGSVVRTCRSTCPRCGRIVPATIVERGGDLYMLKSCPDHGMFDLLYWKDASLYRFARSVSAKGFRCEPPVCAEGVWCLRHLDRTTTVMLDVTGRCNMRCPVCLAGANEGKSADLPLAGIETILPENRSASRPNLCIIGGEPTLHPDLPAIIRLVRARGYIPRLNTNGVRLLNPSYRATLRKAGLDWVILQFDGFDDGIYRKLRGAPLLEKKLRMVDAMLADGFRVQFAVMLVKGINDAEFDRLIRFALEKGVFWLSFYPNAAVMRHDLASEVTHVSEAIDALERATAGRVGRRDIMDTMRLLSILHRLTGREILRQKLSVFPVAITRTRDGYTPITRLLRPLELARNAPAAARLAGEMARMWDFERKGMPRDVVVVNIERFNSAHTIDLEEASECHMCWLTPGGTVAYDVYNCITRATCR